QIAKIMGCRVVGVAGTDEKVDYVLNDLGFDAAVNYRTAGTLLDELHAACPDGVDVHFDNVGGEIADAVLHHLNRNARIVLVGRISRVNDVAPKLVPDPSG